MKNLLFTSSLILLFSAVSYSQRNAPGSEKELLEISARGKMLAEYDQAAWHSTDAVLALSPAKGSFEGYIMQKQGNAWTGAYGKLNEKKDKYLIAFRATQQSSPNIFKVEKFEKPLEDAGFFLKAAKALEISKKAFIPAELRPYNYALLPAPDSQFYVYFLPAQTVNGVFPVGGDMRFLVSGDGSKIMETRQLHKSIIEFKVPRDAKPTSGYSIAVLDNIPEDTDVFHVLARQPKIPQLIVTPKFVYQIKIDGAIIYVMPTEAFMKIGEGPQKP